MGKRIYILKGRTEPAIIPRRKQLVIRSTELENNVCIRALTHDDKIEIMTEEQFDRRDKSEYRAWMRSGGYYIFWGYSFSCDIYKYTGAFETEASDEEIEKMIHVLGKGEGFIYSCTIHLDPEPFIDLVNRIMNE